MTVPPLQTSTRWYFAMKAADAGGNWSGLSNVPSVLDNGFRPDQDGYNFFNWPSTLNAAEGEYLTKRRLGAHVR